MHAHLRPSHTHLHRYDKAVIEEQELSPEARIVAGAGKMDAKKHLAAQVRGASGCGSGG